MATASSELSVYPFTLHQAYTFGHSVMKDVLSLSVLLFRMLISLYSVPSIRTISLILRPFLFFNLVQLTSSKVTMRRLGNF